MSVLDVIDLGSPMARRWLVNSSELVEQCSERLWLAANLLLGLKSQQALTQAFRSLMEWLYDYCLRISEDSSLPAQARIGKEVGGGFRFTG